MDKRDAMSSVVWLVISIVVALASLRLGVGTFHQPGSGFLPFWASVFLAFFASILAGVCLLKKRDAEHPAFAGKKFNWGRSGVIIAALIAYCLALPKMGYGVATFGLMLVLFALGKMKPQTVILGALMAVLLSYCLFGYVLQVPLPRGPWGF
jgi:putative tricarboxylic transport membrane protein